MQRALNGNTQKGKRYTRKMIETDSAAQAGVKRDIGGNVTA
jgi:hypothetical protein